MYKKIHSALDFFSKLMYVLKFHEKDDCPFNISC